MIMFHDQKTLSLNFKRSRSQMFFKISVLIEKIYKKENPPQLFFANIAKFLESYFKEHLRTAASALIITYNHKVSN